LLGGCGRAGCERPDEPAAPPFDQQRAGDRGEPFDISLPGLLKHVRILEKADLVITEKQGRTRQCRLGSEHLDDAAQWIQTYQRRWEGRLGRLGGYLERKKGARR